MSCKLFIKTSTIVASDTARKAQSKYNHIFHQKTVVLRLTWTVDTTAVALSSAAPIYKSRMRPRQYNTLTVAPQ